MVTIKAAAYDIAPRIDPDVRAQLFDPETPNDLTDVVKKLRDSHTPGWLYYYLTEVETPSNLGSGLGALVDDETITETARDYAEADSSIINLAQPGSHNWMSEDPLAPVREQYEEKRATIGETVATAYADAFGEEWPTLTDDDFQDWFEPALVDNMNLLDWAVLEEHASSRSADDPVETVAEWYVKRTREHQLSETLATYDTVGETHDAYFEAKSEWRRSEFTNDHFVDVDFTSDDPKIPIVSPSLPSRDIPMEVLQDRIDDDSH